MIAEDFVELILEKDKFTRPIFLGAFAKDELPRPPPLPSCFIINTDPRSKPGEHWLAVYFNKRGYADFFDSYGNPPHYFGLDKYLFNNSSGFDYNKKRIQGDSSYCGFYCILFLFYKARGEENVFFRQFTSKMSKNDKIITDFLFKFK